MIKRKENLRKFKQIMNLMNNFNDPGLKNLASEKNIPEDMEQKIYEMLYGRKKTRSSTPPKEKPQQRTWFDLRF